MEAVVELRNVQGTRAAMGWAGGHTVIIDRPEGRAGGMGLGFNGAQMLGLALGGCFCNDLRYTAETMGVDLDTVEVTVTVTLEGEPLVTTAAHMQVSCTRTDGGDCAEVIDRARESCMVSISLQRGVAVSIVNGLA
tara:strand:+ start:1983 stop:2390 length:408 start_codon:yes stop_codon:yes gene_type:complete